MSIGIVISDKNINIIIYTGWQENFNYETYLIENTFYNCQTTLKKRLKNKNGFLPKLNVQFDTHLSLSSN